MTSEVLDEFAAHTASMVAGLDTGELLDGVQFTLEQVVTDGSNIAGHFHLVLADGSALVRPGAADNPDVTIRQDIETARALRDGSLHAQGAFLTGRLTVDGDIAKLLEHGPVLTQLLSRADR